MKNLPVCTFSTVCNVAHYAKMPITSLREGTKLLCYKRMSENHLVACHVTNVLLFNVHMFVLRFCSGLLSGFHVGLRIILGCNLACALDGLDFCSPSILDVRHCYKIARLSTGTTTALLSATSAGKKTNLAFITCLVVCRAS